MSKKLPPNPELELWQKHYAEELRKIRLLCAELAVEIEKRQDMDSESHPAILALVQKTETAQLFNKLIKLQGFINCTEGMVGMYNEQLESYQRVYLNK